ncbi:MAG: hypothetical protein AAGM22_17755 [Acidobacteriota bacterium]
MTPKTAEYFGDQAHLTEKGLREMAGWILEACESTVSGFPQAGDGASKADLDLALKTPG